jgi:RNA polymerase sigma-70 factor (ECF subfamily)
MGVTNALDERRLRPLEGEMPGPTRPLAAHVGEDADRAAAFRRLADLQLDRSYRLAAVILGDPLEAQDAVHDAFVTAWRKWDSLRDPSRFEAWFGRIVVNTCRNRLRRAHRWQLRDISDEQGLLADDTIAPVADRVVVRRALDGLKPDDRIILALRYYRDMKVDDIAAALGIHPRAVSSRLHRALERPRHSLDESDQREAVR